VIQRQKIGKGNKSIDASSAKRDKQIVKFQSNKSLRYTYKAKYWTKNGP